MGFLKESLLFFRSAGLKSGIRILKYSLFLAYQNKIKFKNKFKHKPFKNLGAIQNVCASARQINLKFEQAELEIVFLTQDMVKITWAPGKSTPPYAINKIDWPQTQVTIQETNEGWVLSGIEMSLTITKSGIITFTDSAGNLLRKDLAPERKGTSSDTFYWRQKFIPAEDEHFYGLGEQSGNLNLRGKSYHLWNSDPGGSYEPGREPLYTTFPVYIGKHSKGSYLVFYNNSFPAKIDFSGINQGNEPFCSAEFEGGLLSYYFVCGEPKTALQRYAELTGYPSLPPRWALGYHQSRFGYKSEIEIRNVIQGFIDNNLPISGIHLDIDYMDEFRVFTVDTSRFPKFSKFIADLSRFGIKVVAIIDSGVKVDPNYDVYHEGSNQDVFCKLPNGKVVAGVVWPGSCVFPDFTNPAAREWWGKYYRRLIDQGIAGIWHDMNEPTSFSISNTMTLPLTACHDLDSEVGDHHQGHNLYALMMNRAGFEALQNYQSDRRPWILSRAGWAGQQRYAWTWTGDTASSWATLKMTISTVLGLGLSGIAFTGSDIGGFDGNPSAELYLRWFQMAAFMPFFRTHSSLGTQPREPWVYGEPYTTIVREFLNFRYRLLPFFYSLAWESNKTGLPVIRPLFWIDGENKDLWAVDDAFLVGEHMLVAPVLTESTREREVVLPSGAWYDYWSEQTYFGPGRITLPTQLSQIPILLHENSILPEVESERLILKIYPPVNMESIQSNNTSPMLVLFSDAGEGYGDWRLDNFHLNSEDKQLEIIWHHEGAYPFPYNQVEIQLQGSKLKKAYQEHQEIEIVSNRIIIKEFSHIRIELDIAQD